MTWLRFPGPDEKGSFGVNREWTAANLTRTVAEFWCLGRKAGLIQYRITGDTVWFELRAVR